jgi:hypothetical protein
LAPNGERSWRWVELALQVPYFLLSVRVSTKDGEMVRDMVFGQLNDVLNIAAQQSKSLQIHNLGLLSPGYMNGGGCYQLGQVKEIWGAKGKRAPNVFVMADGVKLHFALGGQKSEEHEMELLLAL